MFSQISRLVEISHSKPKRTFQSKIFLITSGKGGVGKTTFISNGAFLLTKAGYKVCIIDADGLANIHIHFQLKPRYSYFDYFKHRVNLDDIIYKTYIDNLSIIAGTSDDMFLDKNNITQFIEMVKSVEQNYKFDIILIDTGAGINTITKELFGFADDILAITTRDPNSLTDVFTIIKIITKIKKDIKLIFNSTDTYKLGELITNSLQTLIDKEKDSLKIDYLGNIPPSNEILTTGRLRKLYAKEFPNLNSTVALIRVFNKILERVNFDGN